MKCEYCNGAGEIINDALRWTSCPVCGGKGFIEKTNEQWFDGLSTEEKAEWLDGVIAYCFGVGHITESEQKKYQKIVADVELWLKQPHNRKDDEE